MEPFLLHHWPQFSLSSNIPHLDQQRAFIDDVTIDSRTIKGESSLFVALRGRRGDGHMYVEEALQNGAKFAIVRSDWQKPQNIQEESLILVEDTLQALQSLASSIRQERAKDIPVIAVGGSTGKTMLKDLMSFLLQDVKNVYTSPESYNSQIGVALSLINMPASASIAFIEMAANQPGEMRKLINMVNPTHAVATNFLRPRYGMESFKGEVATQLFELIQAIPQSNWILSEKVFTDSPAQKEDLSHLYYWNDLPHTFPRARLINIHSKGMSIEITYDEGKKKKQTSLETTLPFVVELVQIALAICHLLNVPLEKVLDKLKSYKPQTMRTEVWKNVLGTTFINSTYSHEALSFAASLLEMSTLIEKPSPNIPTRRALIFGGLHTHRFDVRHKKRIVEALKNLHINHIYYWPSSSNHFIDEHLAKDAGISLYECSDLSSALTEALKKPPQGIPFQTVIFKGADKTPIDWLFQAIEDSPPQTYASINLASIRHNIDLIKQRLGTSTRLMIMVKALAYGTDDVRIAHFLRKCGVDILGVSYVDEGVAMRKRGVEQNIFVINAMPDEMLKAFKWNLEVGVGTKEQIDAALLYAKEYKSPLKLHLHVDTGMKRFGCRPDHAIELAKQIAKHPDHLIFEGLFTHFCSADDASQDEYTRWQASTLEELADKLKEIGITPRYIHAANSAAAMRFHFPSFNMARIGIATYGIYTSSTLKEVMPTLRPALSLVTKVAGINHAQKGDTVSYGRSHIIKNERATIAVLPIGYYDGLHRTYSEKVEVLIRGKKAPMIGRICMDYMMVDISHIPDAEIGDAALIFGEDDLGNSIPLEEFAEKGGSIAHELMTCLGPRIQRLFIYDESLRTR